VLRLLVNGGDGACDVPVLEDPERRESRAVPAREKRAESLRDEQVGEARDDAARAGLGARELAA
jgi:hypothetical protein